MIVVMGHTFNSINPDWLIWIFDGSVGVSVFFVISGFVLPLSLGDKYTYTHIFRFFKKRIVRIEPVYVVSILFSAAILFLKTRYAPNGIAWEPSIEQILSHLFYLVPFTKSTWVNEVYWTLAIEFQFYFFLALTFPVLRWFCIGYGKLFLTVGVLSSLALISHEFESIGLIKHSPFFALGLLTYVTYRDKLSPAKFISLLLVISLLGWLGAHPIKNLAFSVIGASLILYWNPKKNKLVFFGIISYSLYVIHYPIVTLFYQASNYFFEQHQLFFKLSVMSSGFLMSFMFAILLYYLIEKPSQNIAHHIRY